ncbi:MAG: hypothetical protein OEV43_01995, partial [Coriobacteriia bacterium]|nr:hypothetical protein [Coriobacteriia bacterium]
MIQRNPRILSTLCATLLFVATASASAAPVSLEDSTLFVQLYPEEQQGAASMVAYVSIPTDAPLPATVRIPIPQGAEPFWVGEVFDSALSDAIDQERDYEIVDGDGGPVVELTLEETRTAMYEALTGPADTSGSRVSISWVWVQSEPTKDVQFSVTVPAAATLVQVDPAPVVGPR